MIYKYNGVNVTNAGFSDANGVNYPPNWAELASPEDRARVGVVEEEDPVIEVSTPEPRVRFYPLEFLEAFTEAEQLAVVSATLANPQVKLWYDKMLGASFVDITDPRTIAGLDALIGAGLLTAERKAVILTPKTVTE